ncbi:MAG: WbqC family protein, partial [Candidatus Xenobia bacterium]
MRIAIHQPHYIPWLRYLDKIARSDCFVLLDDAQFNRNGYQNRNRVKGPTEPIMLTVPVLQHYQQSLVEVRCNPSMRWQQKHWRTLEQHYRTAPYFETYRTDLRPFYEQAYEHLNDLNAAYLSCLLRLLGIRTPVVQSHTLGITTAATTRLIDICKALNGTEYLSGAHAIGAYLDAETFKQAGI